MEQKFQIIWLRRDLRLHDHPLISLASKESLPTVILFLLDKKILSKLPKDDHRVSLFWDKLQSLQESLDKAGQVLQVFFADPILFWKTLVDKYKGTLFKVYFSLDFDPYPKARDEEVIRILKTAQINFEQVLDHILFHPNSLLKPSGEPYYVYSPFKRNFLKKLESYNIPTYDAQDYKKISKLFRLELPDYQPIKDLKDIGFSKTNIPFPDAYYSPQLLHNYNQTRNFPSLDRGTTKLGTHLRFGFESCRKLFSEALRLKADVWLSELIWREFFIGLLHHHPHLTHEPHRREFIRFRYVENEEWLQRWKIGETGYPIVDAGMRELNSTGYMHNRVRMIVASFLTKNLCIHWRRGERYFSLKLFDYEKGSNVCNWQWVAGCGVDAAPYFRIFNPYLQTEKFDPHREYIKKWVPEVDTPKYPKPMVDFQASRSEALHKLQELKH